MAHTLKLTVYNDGGVLQSNVHVPTSASEVDLNAGSTITLEYIPQTPEQTTVATNDILSDGGELTRISYRNVTESARIILKPVSDGTSSGSSASAMQTTIRQIGRFFNIARRYQSAKIGDRTFVEFQPDGSASLYRSEILAGRIEATPESLDWRWRGASAAEFNLAWTRRFFWEGPVLDISASDNKEAHQGLKKVPDGGSAVSGGSGFNRFDISSTCIEGDLPTPLYFPMAYTIFTAGGIKYWWFTNNVLSSPSSFQFWLEAEDSAIGNADTTLATSSSGAHKSACTTSDSETDMFRWVMNASQVEHSQGNSFHIMTVWTSAPPTTTKFRMEVRAASPNETLWSGEQFTLSESASVHDFGVVKMPYLPLTNRDPLNFVITGEETGGWSASLDVIMFFPANEFRFIKSASEIVNNNAVHYFTDNGIDNLLYVENHNNTARRFGLTGRGDPLYVYPGKWNSISWTAEWNTSGIDPDTRALQLGNVRYRPRILEI